MTKEEYFEGVAMIEETLGKKFTEGQVKMYYLILKDLLVDDFKNGIVRLFAERVYTNIPSPAEIIQYSTNTKSEDIEARVMKAKASFEKIVGGSCPNWATIGVADPILLKVFDVLGGWISAKKMSYDEIENFLKFEFEKTYKAYLKNNDVGEMKTILVGMNDLKNGVEDPVPTIFVGGEENFWRMHNAYQEKLKDGTIKKLITDTAREKGINNLIENKTMGVDKSEVCNEFNSQ